MPKNPSDRQPSAECVCRARNLPRSPEPGVARGAIQAAPCPPQESHGHRRVAQKIPHVSGQVSESGTIAASTHHPLVRSFSHGASPRPHRDVEEVRRRRYVRLMVPRTKSWKKVVYEQL